MDNDDLETTLRHGLRELANDAPRGEDLWETTASMIAIQPEQPAEPEPPAPAAPQKQTRSGFLLGILIGLLIAAVIAGAIAAVLTLRDSDGKRGVGITNPTTGTTLSKSKATRPETSAAVPPGPIPAGDVLFNDNAKARIVVADRSLKEIGLIAPSSDATWRALQLSRDRAHLFIAKTSEANGCDEVWDLDLQTRALRPVVQQADVVALSPDASKAVVQWGPGCSALTRQPSGQVALRDIAANRDVVLPEISGGGQVNVAWNPDGTRVATQPYGTRHAVIYDAQGRLFVQFDRPKSSQDGLGWTADGLVFVDLGVDRTAVLRTYDSGTGRAVGELARIPQVYVGGDHGPLVTPQVSAIRDAGGRTYVELRGGADALTYAQLRVIDHGRARIVRDGWYSREFVG
jgi:YD repeat-containing protein